MGRSGNVKGYKVFSINTSVRNPGRNIEFLKIIKDYDRKELTREIKEEIYVQLIKYGIYQVNIKSQAVIDKYKDKEILTDSEIAELIRDNPQKTTNGGRVMTQIRALKDQGLVELSGTRNKKKLKITRLGNDLLMNKDVEDTYSKAMIGLHANNPQREAMYNKSRPFLNTLFVLDELEKYCKENNLEYKGILYHEFGAFVLSMKDCNYKRAVQSIISYREMFGKKINKEFIYDYLYNVEELVEVNLKNIIEEYPDDVRRKFEMTSIIESHGYSTYKYIRINEFNRAKANSILEKYKDYAFKEFNTSSEYEEFLYNIELPWQLSDDLKKQMVQDKQEKLKVAIEGNKSLDDKIKELDRIYNRNIFCNYVETKVKLPLVIKEILILTKHLKAKSKYDDIAEPLRLEWLIALLTAKIYGPQYVKPNMLLNSNGEPRYYAKGGKADIEFETDNIYYILETTMITNATQQENAETTSVADHLQSIETQKEKAAILIAPVIHKRTAMFYQYCCVMKSSNMLPITIDMYVDLVVNTRDEQILINEIHKLISSLVENDEKNYTDRVNDYRSIFIEQFMEQLQVKSEE